MVKKLTIVKNNSAAKNNSPAGLTMYFNQPMAAKFAALEQNEKNFRVSAILDLVATQEIKDLANPIKAVDLGGGAHPDRYHRLFERLLKKPLGHLDWVDISPPMLELAREYLSPAGYKERLKVIKFISADILTYLHNLPDNNLDLALMKYTINNLASVDWLIELLAQKLKTGGRFVSTIGFWSPELKSVHTNARIIYQGQELPEDDHRLLQDGDSFNLKFFKESGHPESGYLAGAEVTEYYHSPARFRLLAQAAGLEIFFGAWQDLVPRINRGGEDMNQVVLVLRKNQ